MACSSIMPSSISTTVADEKHHSSPATPKPWRQAKPSTPTSPGSPKRDPCLSPDDCSSTDAGDDITTVFVDLADFSSSESDDCEVADDCTSSSPRASTASMATCMYSVMMLLRVRASVCKDEDLDGVRYSTQARSERPSPTTPKSKQSPKARTDTLESAGSWRQALPASSAASWVAQQRNRNPAEDENVTRALRSILNKLTVEKFDSLFEQLTNCGIAYPHHISILMREVFEKATIQHHFIPMYAQLCVQLENHPQIVSAVEGADEAGHLQSFRRLLLNECQSVFMQVFESHSAESELEEDAAFRRKQRALGNMKLIGHLLVNGMLSSNLFVECCEQLLCKHEQCSEALEALVALMMVAAPKFDKSGWQYYRRLEKILLDMNSLTKDKKVPPRLRFLIRDVLDARDAGWPHSKGSEIGPSKLEEVRNAAESAKTPQSDPKPVEIVQTTSTRKDSLAKAAPWNTKKTCAAEAEVPQVAPETPAPAPQAGFQLVAFRREVNAVFNELSSERNIPAAVQRIREQKVPVEHQAAQFVDILTRIVEERRGAVRRCELAFIAGLGAAGDSAFDRAQCLAGVEIFFRDVYSDLCSEVHRLPAIMKSEFMPTMLTVFPGSDLNDAVPSSFRK